jgi:phosphoribosylanthranilate isomerase
MKVKLCGFTDLETIAFAVENFVDFIGLVFYEKSVRNVSISFSKEASKIIPKSVGKVAVVVNPSLELLRKIAENFNPDYFQMHGDESKNEILEIKKHFSSIKIIKVIKLSNKSDLSQVVDFIDLADIFLFDTKLKNVEGGSGKSFDWKILQGFSCKKQWFLSGGINVDNIDFALETTGAAMVDISSGIEEIRGKKSKTAIRFCLKTILNQHKDTELYNKII